MEMTWLYWMHPIRQMAMMMICYNGSNEKVKLQVTSPDGTEYTYPVTVSVIMWFIRFRAGMVLIR